MTEEIKAQLNSKGIPDGLTPAQIVEKLDNYIIGQQKAKRFVAVALRNRQRRIKLPEEIRDEVAATETAVSKGGSQIWQISCQQ